METEALPASAGAQTRDHCHDATFPIEDNAPKKKLQLGAEESPAMLQHSFPCWQGMDVSRSDCWLSVCSSLVGCSHITSCFSNKMPAPCLEARSACSCNSDTLLRDRIREARRLQQYTTGTRQYEMILAKPWFNNFQVLSRIFREISDY